MFLKRRKQPFLSFSRLLPLLLEVGFLYFYLIIISYIHTSIVDKNSPLFFLCIYFGELWTALILFLGCQPIYTHLTPLVLLCKSVGLAAFSRFSPISSSSLINRKSRLLLSYFSSFFLLPDFASYSLLN